MNQEFKQCLENKKIVPFARGKRLVKKELSVAKSDLSDAKAGYENDDINGQLFRAIMRCFTLPERLYTRRAIVKRATTAWP